MSAPEIRRGMVLAAGLGKRLRPITERVPKPLLAVGGRTMLDRALDHLAAAGIEQAVVNIHYLGEQIRRHLAGRSQPRIAVSEEPELLETGGGVRKALPHLGPGPFVVANGDAIWLDGPTPALDRLRRAWDDSRMDALLMLYPTTQELSFAGLGDFMLDPLGRARRRREREIAPLLFTGTQILHPRLFAGSPEGPFSLNLLYDRAEAQGRLYAIVHDGAWYHVGTAEGLALAEEALTRRHSESATR